MHKKFSRKNTRIGIRAKNNSGIILIVVLWVLVILSMLAIGLSRKVKVDLALTKYAVGKVKSRYAAMAGLSYAMALMHQDSKDPDASQLDSKFQCGFVLGTQGNIEDFFKDKAVGDGKFSISYRLTDADNTRSTHYGFEDEESKININALNSNNYEMLKHLISQLGFDDEAAQTVASSVVDWVDADSEVFNSPFGAEDDAYSTAEALFPCKNKPFDSIEEVMLVKGMTPEIFKKMKSYITVFPRQDTLKINFETASPFVLRALARNVTGPQTNAGIPDADSLVERLLSFRQGEDGQLGTPDDLVIDGNQLGLNANESSIFQAMSYNRTQVSNYLRVHIKGLDEISEVFTTIDAVVDRRDLSLVYWRRS